MERTTNKMYSEWPSKRARGRAKARESTREIRRERGEQDSKDFK